jgi:multicomponent Na+:H+ antiporter subunit G
MTDWIAAALVVSGSAFALLAAVGVLRMPDVFLRMQVATKAATMGVACTALGAGTYFAEPATSARAGLIVFFLFLTAPVAAHAIARATYRSGARLWEGTVADDLRGRYAAPDPAAPPGGRGTPGGRPRADRGVPATAARIARSQGGQP